MWNPLHNGWQSGRHNYTNRCIEIDSKNKNKANATWNFIGFFSNKSNVNTKDTIDHKSNIDNNKLEKQPVFMNILIYKGKFIKIYDRNGKGMWKAKYIHTAADLMGVELNNAFIKKGALFAKI